MSKEGRTFTVIKILISDKVLYSKVLFKSHPSQVPVMEGEEGSRSRSKFARLVNKDGVINITYRTLLWSNPLTRIFEGSVRAYSSSFWLACKHWSLMCPHSILIQRLQASSIWSSGLFLDSVSTFSNSSTAHCVTVLAPMQVCTVFTFTSCSTFCSDCTSVMKDRNFGNLAPDLQEIYIDDLRCVTGGAHVTIWLSATFLLALVIGSVPFYFFAISSEYQIVTGLVSQVSTTSSPLWCSAWRRCPLSGLELGPLRQAVPWPPSCWWWRASSASSCPPSGPPWSSPSSGTGAASSLSASLTGQPSPSSTAKVRPLVLG